MAMNFGEMFLQVGQFIQDTSTGRETRIKDSINRQYTVLAKSRDWNELKRMTRIDVFQVAGQEFVFFPKHVELVKKIISTTVPDILQPVSPEVLFDQRFINIDTASSSIQYSTIGQSFIKAPYSTTSESIAIVSSDSGDTVDINLEVWGRVGSDEIRETIVVNGTTTVTSSNTFDDISRIGIDGTRDGVITITGSTSTTEYATLAPEESYPSYQMARVWPIDGSQQNFIVLYKKKVFPLVADGDVPEFPCEEALVQLAIGDILRQQHKWSPAREHERAGKEIARDYLSQYLMQTEQVIMSNPLGRNNRGRRRTTIVVKQ